MSYRTLNFIHLRGSNRENLLNHLISEIRHVRFGNEADFRQCLESRNFNFTYRHIEIVVAKNRLE